MKCFWDSAKVTKECLYCGKEFITNKCIKTKYCTQKCANKSPIRNKKIAKTMVIRREGKPGMGWYYDPKSKRKQMSEIMINKWKDPIFAKKIVSKTRASPNKTELFLQKLLNDINSQWKFVGDGQFVIGYPPKNPDFVNKKQRIILELFGEYWHNHSEVAPLIEHYKKYNFNCIVVWYKEVKKLKTPFQLKILMDNTLLTNSKSFNLI